MTRLYEATVDDMIRAFMQIINYHSWLKGGSSGEGYDQLTSKLKVVVHIGYSKLLTKAMRSYPKVKDLNTSNCALEGQELFGTTKKINKFINGFWWENGFSILLLGWRRGIPNKVNIVTPNKRSTRAHIEESLTHDENWCLAPHVCWSQSVRNMSDTFLNCLIHWRKSVMCCWPTKGIFARPKWGRHLVFLRQFIVIWWCCCRNTRIHGRAYYIWMGIIWWEWLPSHTLNLDAS